MCIHPKFLNLFQCIPFKVPKSFFDALNKSLCSFLQKVKSPRVKLSTLQAPYWGLNLPNFRCYYLAALFRSVWCWLHGDKCVARWLPIEQHQSKHVPLKSLPFLTSSFPNTLKTLLRTLSFWTLSLHGVKLVLSLV